MDTEIGWEKLLACPSCKGQLIAQRGPAGSDGFCCRSCRLFYPVIDGIPVMLVGDAVRLDRDGC